MVESFFIFTHQGTGSASKARAMSNKCSSEGCSHSSDKSSHDGGKHELYYEL